MAIMIARFVPSMKHRITSLLVLAALTCAFGAAQAEKADRSKPMNIEADALRHDEVKQTSVFSGRVVMTKGSIVLRGARLDVRQDADGYQSGIVTAEAGKRALFRQKRDTLPPPRNSLKARARSSNTTAAPTTCASSPAPNCAATGVVP